MSGKSNYKNSCNIVDGRKAVCLQPVISQPLTFLFHCHCMTRSKLNALLTAGGLALLQLSAAAQTDVNDSSLYAQSLKNTVGVYEKAMTTESPIVNGRQYKPYTFTFIKEGHPFFQTNQYAAGTVNYEDKFYENVKLLFDQHLDMVILDAGVRVELINDRLPEFTIADHRFVRLPINTVNQVLPTGYYEILHTGGLNLYKKEYKEFKEVLSVTEGYQVEVLDKVSYFIQKDNQFHRVKNKGALLDILRDRRGEVEKYIQSNRLNFRRDKENTITKAVIYYDQLIRPR